MVTLKIEAKTDSYEGAVILIKEALRQISEGAQAGVIGGGIGECMFDVDLSAAQQNRGLISLVSYCAVHNTYPETGEPCWACANPFIQKAYEGGLQAAPKNALRIGCTCKITDDHTMDINPACVVHGELANRQ